MPHPTQAIHRQYHQANLSAKLLDALARAGKDPDALTRDDLIPFDEFHAGGRAATRELARLAALQAGTQALDLGCGVGGAARTLAAEFGCRVTGLDIVPAYCQAAEMLTARVGLSDRVTYHHGDAVAPPFKDGSFDVVWSQHTLMNVADKGRLFRQVRRVLRPGGRFALHTICAGPTGPPHFPLPWADEPSISFLVDPEKLRRLLRAAAFHERVWRDVSAETLEWFRRAAARQATRGADAPPPLGMHLLMGENTVAKLANLQRDLQEERVRVVQAVLAAPVQRAGEHPP